MRKAIIVGLIVIVIIGWMFLIDNDPLNKAYETDDNYKGEKPYHPRDAVYAVTNHTLAGDKAMSDETLDGSYECLWPNETILCTFEVIITGVFMLYYIIRSEGWFLINDTECISDSFSDYEEIGFVNNSSCVVIMITAGNFRVDIGELFGMDYSWLERKPERVFQKKVINFFIDWEKIIKYWGRCVNDEEM